MKKLLKLLKTELGCEFLLDNIVSYLDKEECEEILENIANDYRVGMFEEDFFDDENDY